MDIFGTQRYTISSCTRFKFAGARREITRGQLVFDSSYRPITSSSKLTSLPQVIWGEGRVAAGGIRIRFAVFPQCTGQADRRTYARSRPTDRPTDRSLESLTTIGCCAPKATWPNNSDNALNRQTA